MIRFLTIAVTMLAFTGLACADVLYPKLHDVTGVASDDILNVRAEPHASAAIIGTLTHDGTGIEILGADTTGKWGLLNIGEQTGWAALRYLRAIPETGGYQLSRQFTCFGTEPFWSLAVEQGSQATLTQPGAEPQTMQAGLLSTGRNRTDRFLLELGADALLLISHAQCSDGMSDLLYGLDASLISLSNGPVLSSGCCTLELR